MKDKRFIGILLVMCGLFMITGCQERHASPGTGAQPAAAVQTIPVVTNLVGQWHQTKNGFSGVTMFAVVSGNNIEINMTMSENGDGMTGLYWQGSFDPTKTGTQTSKEDVDAMADSLMAQDEPTKTFTYDGTHLSFQFGMLHMTTTVELSKGAQ